MTVFFNIKLVKTEVVWYLLKFLLLRNEDMVESYVSLLRGDGDGGGDGGGDGVFLVYALLHTSWLILISYYR